MALEDVCEHTAWPVRTLQPDPDSGGGGGTWVEGDWVPDDTPEPGDVTGAPTTGTPFDCALFLPISSEQGGGAVIFSYKQITEPTLLYIPTDRAGAFITLSGEDELLIMAEELNVQHFGVPPQTQMRWQVVGDPQPFGRPGDDVIGFQARLRRVTD